MKKKILIITRAFYPMKTPRSYRITELALEFSRQGHELTVLTHKKNKIHQDFERKHNLKIEDLGKKVFSDDPTYTDSIFSYFRKGTRIILKKYFEYPDIQLMLLAFKALKRKSGYDLLISNAQPFPIHWGTALAYTKYDIANVWVADCGDPYVNNENSRFKKPFYFSFIENYFLKKANYISVPFNKMIKYFNSNFHDKFKVIPQGIKFDNFTIFNGGIDNPVPTFIYSGTIYKGRRDLSEIIDYLQEKKMDYKFIIYTRNTEVFSKYSSILNKKLFVKDYVSREKLIYRLSNADFLVNVNTEKSGNGEFNAVPSKLIDYSVAQRPIFNYEFGKFNKHTFDEFLKGNYKNRYVVENIDDYKIENVVDQFLELID
jgi:glycosyltransferase involved in cell wall biosynthesis